MKRLLLAIGIALVGVGSACSRSASPTFVAPSGSISGPTGPAQPSAPLTLNGYVNDTAFRPISGARLEVVTGPDAGKELTSDDKGFFSYTGTFPSVSIRATKEGYIAMTSSVFPNTTLGVAWVSFLLAPLAPSVDAAGNYTLSITVDSACVGFPDEVRTRSYAAQLTKHTATILPANTRFDGTVSGAQFAPYANIFFVGVAGDYLAISTEGEGPSIVEQVGPKSYIAYTGTAGSPVAAGATMIAAPFTGLIEYCELKSPIGQYRDCSDALAVVKAQCTSPHSRLSLTPR